MKIDNDMIPFDLSTAAGAAGVLAYLTVMLASYGSRWSGTTPSLALIATVLTVLSYLRTGVSGPLLAGLALQLALFWTITALGLAYRRSRDRLQERSARLTTLMDTEVDGIILIDDTGTVTDYNAACERLFGYRSHEVVGRNVRMLMPPPYRDEHDAYLERYRRTGERRIIGSGREVEARRKDGSTFPLELSVGETQEADKRMFVGIIRDISARKAAEQELRDREARLRAVINTAVDGVIIIDEHGNVQDYNPACERLFGYKAEEVVGRNVKTLMPSPYADQHDEYLARYRRTGEHRIIGIGREVEGRRKDGSTFPLELSVGKARQGDAPVFVGIIRDATERKRVAAELQNAKERAEAANQAKSVFLANMSHEIRTPMNAVLGYAQLLENDPDLPDRARQALGAISNAGNHLMSLISDVLDISKIEAGAEKLELEDFALDHLLQGLSDIFSVRCEEKGLEWRVVREFDDREVLGDQRKLRQILINFLGNAVKFTERGAVTLRVAQSGRSYQFDVQDTGPGIAPGVREQIFEPFQQAEQGVSKGGTGLGLAIAKQQIDLMGGELELKSEPGEGSYFSFRVELPPAGEAVAVTADNGGFALRLATDQHVSALVVDDTADNRDILARMLQGLGVEVSVANDGEQALTALERSLTDIVFMDMRMPVMGGREALERIRKLWPGRRPVCIAVSASGITHERRDYLDLGFNDFIGKPFRFQTVIECMERHLDVIFERVTPKKPPANGRPETGEAPAVTLPEAVRKRLRRAVELNAFTEIEGILDDLRSRGSPTGQYADYLNGFLVRYDRAGLLAALEQTAHE